MNHVEVWEAEVFVSATEAAWLAWIDRVEELLGHSADGDLGEDGYSMDTFWGMFQRGLSPEMAVKA